MIRRKNTNADAAPHARPGFSAHALCDYAAATRRALMHQKTPGGGTAWGRSVLEDGPAVWWRPEHPAQVARTGPSLASQSIRYDAYRNLTLCDPGHSADERSPARSKLGTWQQSFSGPEDERPPVVPGAISCPGRCQRGGPVR